VFEGESRIERADGEVIQDMCVFHSAVENEITVVGSDQT
jgi:hypothetical protein